MNCIKKKYLIATTLLTIGVAIGGVTYFFLQQQGIFSGETLDDARLLIYAEARQVQNTSADGYALTVSQNGPPTYQITVSGLDLVNHGEIFYGDSHMAYDSMIDGLMEIRSVDDDNVPDPVVIALDSISMPTGYESATLDYLNVTVPGYTGNGAYIVDPANLLVEDATGALSDSGNSNVAGWRCLHAKWGMTDQDIGPAGGTWGFTLNITVTQG